MAAVGRYQKLVARAGHGDALAAKLLEVARELNEAPGCVLYVINRSPADREVIWVTELWTSQEALEGALGTDAARARTPAVLELIDRDQSERVDLEPVGGVGFPDQGEGFTIVDLNEVQDAAARFGFEQMGEARFARWPLQALSTGLSLQRLRPGTRQPFGHLHDLDEETYIVLEGSGDVAIDDQVLPIRALHAIRVAPGSTRAFQAGSEGLTVLATGTHHGGDARMVPGYWPSR